MPYFSDLTPSSCVPNTKKELVYLFSVGAIPFTDIKNFKSNEKMPETRQLFPSVSCKGPGAHAFS